VTDLSLAIAPKSDQLNTDDLIGGPRTIVVTRVTVSPGEQPVAIYFSGDGGKPYKPCKSMCRVLVIQWGADGDLYVGRSMTLYRDPTVTWGGMAVGGIRISHLSDISADAKMALTESRKARGIYTVRRLERPTESASAALITRISTAPTIEDLSALASEANAQRWSGADKSAIRSALDGRKQSLSIARQPGED
jgi:hypothetical protein